MDLTTLRVLSTVVSFLVFLLIIWWAFARSNQQRFREAAHLPLEDDAAVLKAEKINGGKYRE